MNVYGYGTESLDSRFVHNFYAGEVFVDGVQVMLHTGEPLVYMPMELKLNLTGSQYEKTAGARMAKYEVDRKAFSDGRQPDNDIVLFRYADALPDENTAYTTVFPIPSRVIDLNPGLEQNPGYRD